MGGPLRSASRAMARAKRVGEHDGHRITPEAAMNFMMLQPAKPRPMRLRAPNHELTLVEPDSVIAAAPTADDDFSRCGWFDSSLELREGLQVVEYIDQLPQELPLELA
jgi:hypothetical protein